MLKLLNYIGGEFVPSRTNQWLSAVNPSTGNTLHELPDSDAEDVEAAVQAASQALRLWRMEAPEKRADILTRIAAELEKRAQEFSVAESANQGKPLSVVQSLDIPTAIHFFREAARHLLQSETTATTMPNGRMQYTTKEPLGVCALIVPWNFPLMLLAQKIAPALAAGNCVVCKPSELTSHTAFLLAQLFHDLGIPRGIANFIFGRGSLAGAALVQNSAVHAVSFTGGTTTGRALAGEAVRSMKALDLEMGGKNAGLIFADCDQGAAISSALRSCFLNSGQVCLSTSRLFIERKIFSEFTEKLIEKMKRLNIGDPMARATFIGPLISEAHRRKVQEYVDSARALNLRVEVGQEPPKTGDLEKGYFISPAVIFEPPLESSIMQEEIFGPIVTVHPFDTADEAVKAANGTRYGLAAGVWTSRLSTAQQVSQDLNVGTVWVNSWMSRVERLTLSGRKDSGYGLQGVGFYTQTKFVHMNF